MRSGVLPFKLSTRVSSLALGLTLVLAPTALHAGGVTLPAGKLNVHAAVEINLSEDAVAKPLSIAPDVAYGVTDDLTVSLIHSTFGITGFRGSAGRGLCLSGEDGGCANVYDNVGAEAMYALTAGDLSVAALGGVHALSLDAGFYDLKAGVRVRWSKDKVAVTSTPAVTVELAERDLNKDRLWLPVAAQYKLTPELALGGSTGIKAPLDGFGDAWEVSLGASATYAVSPALTLGGSFVFGKIVGGADDTLTGPEFRAVHLWASFTR